MRRSVRPRARGFTIVELLVVIGIITVLLAIFLPALQKARQQAMMIGCASNERQIAMAVLCYANENRGILPVPLTGYEVGGGQGTTIQPWYAIYMVSPAVFDYANGTLWPYLGPSAEARRRVFNCPADPDPRPLTNPSGAVWAYRNFSYNFNKSLAAPNMLAPGTFYFGVKLFRIRQPDHKLLILEPSGPFAPAGDVNVGGTGGGGSAIVIPLLTTRHFAEANVCCADGHVEAILPGIFNGTISNGGFSVYNEAYRRFMDFSIDR